MDEGRERRDTRERKKVGERKGDDQDRSRENEEHQHKFKDGDETKEAKELRRE